MRTGLFLVGLLVCAGAAGAAVTATDDFDRRHELIGSLRKRLDQYSTVVPKSAAKRREQLEALEKADESLANAQSAARGRKARAEAAQTSEPAEPEQAEEPASEELSVSTVRVGRRRSPAPDVKLPPAVPVSPSPCALDLRCRTDVGAAKGHLGSLRAALAIYYGDKEGEYPPTLAALVPKYLPFFPAIAAPGHQRTSRVTVVTKAKGTSAEPYVRDTGGWLYFRVPGNEKLDGTVVIDCKDLDDKGKALWTY